MMIPNRRALAWLLLASLLVSGCLAGPSEGSLKQGPGNGGSAGAEAAAPVEDRDQEPSGAEPEPGSSAPPPSTAVPEPTSCGRADSQVSTPENATFDGAAHSHDRWGTNTALVLFDGPVEPINGGWFAMPGAVVPPGTGKVAFEVYWSNAVALLPESRTLQWNLPNDKPDEWYSGEFGSSGDSVSMEVQASAADPAHYERTTWKFKLDADADVVFTAFRGCQDLPIDPPHLDVWGGDIVRLWADIETSHSTLRVADSGQGVFYGWNPESGTVPPATGRMVVRMEWQQQPVPTSLGLELCTPRESCGSTTADWNRPLDFTTEGTTARVYDVVVAPEDWDSPYIQRSGWMFRWFFDNADAVEAGGETGRYEGTIRWTVEIHKL